MVTLRVLHPLYDQTITLLRRQSTVADVLKRLGLPMEYRIKYHLSFDGVWLSESVSIQEVSSQQIGSATVILARG